MVSRMMRIVPSPLRKMIIHVGRRGLFLLFFGMLWSNTGYRWTEVPPTSPAFRLLFDLFPPELWGLFLIAMALLMAAGAFWKRIEDLSYGVSTWVASFFGVMSLWASIGLVQEDRINAVTVSGIYFFYAFLVWVVSGWPESPIVKDNDGP